MASPIGGIVLGIMTGALIGYAYSESKTAMRAVSRGRKAIKEAGVRLPKPDFAMQLPLTVEHFGTLDETICGCAEFIQQNQPGLELNDFVEAVRDCVAKAIYPDFPWPPIPGDHPSVSYLWTILTYEVGRGAVEGTLCLTDESNDLTKNPHPQFPFIQSPAMR